MRFLVTGVTGFVGRHLVKKLEENGHEVIACSNHTEYEVTKKYKKFFYLDFNFATGLDTYYNILTSERFDGIFHLAAITNIPNSFINPIKYFRINCQGTVAFCEAVKLLQPRAVFMYCSTSEVYGEVEGKITEEVPLNPINPYGVSKAAADFFVQEITKHKRLHGFITRAFAHTGPGRRPEYSISSDAIQIAQILKGLKNNAINVGNLKTQRVVMDVRDVVDVYYELMMKYLQGKINRGEIFNISGDTLYSMEFFLFRMLELYNLKGKVFTKADPKLFREVDIKVQDPDSTKVRKFLNWKPKINIDQTLKDLVEYWLDHPDLGDKP